MTTSHRFFIIDSTPPPKAFVNSLAAELLNMYAGEVRTVAQYKAMGLFTIHTIDDQEQEHDVALRFDQLVEAMRVSRSWPYQQLRVRKPLSPWLDGSVWVALDGPALLADGTYFEPVVPTALGNFPLTPAINREGMGMSSLQIYVQQEILRLRTELVEGKASPVDPDGTWFATFRSLLGECVSIVDMTLHQLYFMAQYGGSEFGWTFDPGVLGGRRRRTLSDKLHWVRQITGKPLDNVSREVSSFNVLKGLRNHLDHFDPPCFAFHLEEAAAWLNLVPDVGRLLWKIRRKLDADVSQDIISMTLLPSVRFVPINSGAPRPPDSPTAGYKSSISSVL